MAISLYDVSVTSFLQTLGGVAGVLERGLSHARDNNLDLAEIVGARLFPDMLPFSYQITSVVHHTLGAIEDVRAGSSTPAGPGPARDYAELQALVAETQASLKALDPAEINGFEGRDMVFIVGERKIPFTAEGFLMSFSLPNLHFHATTAYDILRTKGTPLSKRDYLGAMRLRA